MSAVSINVVLTTADRVRASIRGEWTNVALGTVIVSMPLEQGEELHDALGKALIRRAEAGS